MSVDSTGEVHGGGQDRGAGAHRQRRGPGGHRGALAEELDLGSAALEIAVREQAHDVIVTKRPHHGGAGLWAERDDVHPEGRAQLDEPLEELRRVDLLDHHRDLVALLRDPSARPLPPAEVRQHEDDAVSLRESVDDVLVAVHVEPSLDGRTRQVREAEALEPVVGVGVERFLDGPTKSEAAE